MVTFGDNTVEASVTAQVFRGGSTWSNVSHEGGGSCPAHRVCHQPTPSAQAIIDGEAPSDVPDEIGNLGPAEPSSETALAVYRIGRRADRVLRTAVRAAR